MLCTGISTTIDNIRGIYISIALRDHHDLSMLLEFTKCAYGL